MRIAPLRMKTPYREWSNYTNREAEPTTNHNELNKSPVVESNALVSFLSKELAGAAASVLYFNKLSCLCLLSSVK